ACGWIERVTRDPPPDVLGRVPGNSCNARRACPRGEMTLGDAALLLLAGGGAGAVNAVAGGGSLLSFPALLAAGYAPVTANVSISISVLPGYAGGSLAYREELRGQGERVLRLGVTAAAGGAAGAIVLLETPSSAFDAIVPFLVAGASLLLLIQPR